MGQPRNGKSPPEPHVCRPPLDQNNIFFLQTRQGNSICRWMGLGELCMYCGSLLWHISFSCCTWALINKQKKNRIYHHKLLCTIHSTFDYSPTVMIFIRVFMEYFDAKVLMCAEKKRSIWQAFYMQLKSLLIWSTVSLHPTSFSFHLFIYVFILILSLASGHLFCFCKYSCGIDLQLESRLDKNTNNKWVQRLCLAHQSTFLWVLCALSTHSDPSGC